MPGSKDPLEAVSNAERAAVHFDAPFKLMSEVYGRWLDALRCVAIGKLVGLAIGASTEQTCGPLVGLLVYQV